MQDLDIETLLRWTFRVERADLRRDADPDAQTIYWAVMALPDRHSRLVAAYARSGTRPPRASSAGRVIDLGLYRSVRQTREDWFSALVLLRRILDGPLINYRPVGPVEEVDGDRVAG